MNAVKYTIHHKYESALDRTVVVDSTHDAYWHLSSLTNDFKAKLPCYIPEYGITILEVITEPEASHEHEN